MATFISKYNFGDILYLRTDPDQRQWMVCEIEFRPGDVVVYSISSGTDSIDVYEFEVTDEVDISKKLGLNDDKQKQ